MVLNDLRINIVINNKPMALTSFENIFEEPSVINEIKRKSSFYCLLMAPSDKKLPTKIQMPKLDLDLIKIKHTRSESRNTYSNNQQTHSHLNTADTEALTSNRSKGEKVRKSILRKETKNKESSNFL